MAPDPTSKICWCSCFPLLLFCIFALDFKFWDIVRYHYILWKVSDNQKKNISILVLIGRKNQVNTEKGEINKRWLAFRTRHIMYNHMPYAIMNIILDAFWGYLLLLIKKSHCPREKYDYYRGVNFLYIANHRKFYQNDGNNVRQRTSSDELKELNSFDLICYFK